MKLRATRRQWNAFAATDPFWAVLTESDRKGRRWPVEEFFAHGREEVAAELHRLRQLHPAMRLGSALDFGCGVGRLTQALAGHFSQVTGLDLAEKMLALARSHNRHGARVSYLHNPHPDLRLFADHQFDFVYSLITLQHLEPAYIRRYLAEFVRVTAPGGLLVFQLPALLPPPVPPRPFTLWPDTLLRRFLRDLRRRLAARSLMEMHAMPRAEVEALLCTAGAEILDVRRSPAAGPDIESWHYVARQP